MNNFDTYKKDHISVIESFNDYDTLDKVIQEITKCLRKRLPVLIFGNGGSAADALHFSAELVGKFLKERQALNVICLNANQSTLTAWSNDYEFDTVFERQVEAHGQEAGIVIGISTSGMSANVLNGLKKAKSMNMTTIMMTGENFTSKDIVDYCIHAPSAQTPLIQECHILIYHYICQEIERYFEF
jgi:D-sedoheptulose 7-phosphate isomerase